MLRCACAWTRQIKELLQNLQKASKSRTDENPLRLRKMLSSRKLNSGSVCMCVRAKKWRWLSEWLKSISGLLQLFSLQRDGASEAGVS
eukprot:1140254-Pelagomonas_calceolata.AAC.1